MDTLNKKYFLQMEVLTPLHIGGGAEKDWIQGSDFVIHDGKVKILNLKKVVEYVNVDDLSSFLMKKDDVALVRKLGSNLDKCIDKEFECDLVGTNDIKTCIKNGLTNLPFVPGSSLKGALRSVLLDVLHTKFQLSNAKENNGRLNEQGLFGSASKGDEFFRFVKVSDAQFEKTVLVNTKIFNLRELAGGWKHAQDKTGSHFDPSGFNTFYEVLEPGEMTIFSISLAIKAFENFGANKFDEKKQNIIKSDISVLFKMINTHTKKYLLKEKAFFQKYLTDKTISISDSIDKLILSIPENGEYCILKMAAGSGFHSITGDWQFDDYSINGVFQHRGTLNGAKSSKSRKIAVLSDDDLCLMGFIKLKTVNDDELQLHETESRKRRTEIEIQQKEHEALIVEKRRIELEIELEKQRINVQYQELIHKAGNSYDLGYIDEAQIAIEKAISCCPEGKLHFDLLGKVERAKAILQKESEARLAQQDIEQSRINANKVLLSDKLAKLDKFPTIFGSVKTWMKINEINVLELSELDALSMKLKELYFRMKPNDQKAWSDLRKWSELSKVIGDENTRFVFKQVTD